MPRSNEELAIAIQRGGREASAELLAQNQKLLRSWALNTQRQYGLACWEEDLCQEGAIALLEAAESFDPKQGVKLMTYAEKPVRQAMRDHAATLCTFVSIPLTRLRQIRRAAWLDANAPRQMGQVQREGYVAERMGVSHAAARKLLQQSDTFLAETLADEVWDIPSERLDPEGEYERELFIRHLTGLIDTALTARERTLLIHYFGLEDEEGKGMTFEMLAARLNYNGPSGAEKALKTAVQKLKRNLHSSEYGVWRDAKRMIREARAKAEADPGYCSTPQTTWWEEKKQTERHGGSGDAGSGA